MKEKMREKSEIKSRFLNQSNKNDQICNIKTIYCTLNCKMVGESMQVELHIFLNIFFCYF